MHSSILEADSFSPRCRRDGRLGNHDADALQMSSLAGESAENYRFRSIIWHSCRSSDRATTCPARIGISGGRNCSLLAEPRGRAGGGSWAL